MINTRRQYEEADNFADNNENKMSARSKAWFDYIMYRHKIQTHKSEENLKKLADMKANIPEIDPSLKRYK
tara:strand:- start:677 stop:886 length:210 start_codon:yes stop_codon:yes gene_type:complete